MQYNLSRTNTSANLSPLDFNSLINVEYSPYVYCSNGGGANMVVNLPAVSSLKSNYGRFIVIVLDGQTGITINTNGSDVFGNAGAFSGSTFVSYGAAASLSLSAFVFETTGGAWMQTGGVGANSGGAVPQTTKVSLTSTQILSLNTSPVVIIPAQGAGTVVQPIAAIVSYTFVSAAYTTHTQLVILNQGQSAGNYIFTAGSILGNTSSVLGYFQPNIIGSLGTFQANQNIVVSVNSGNPVAGDSTATVYVTWQTIVL